MTQLFPVSPPALSLYYDYPVPCFSMTQLVPVSLLLYPSTMTQLFPVSLLLYPSTMTILSPVSL